MKIGLFIGHSRRGDSGAGTYDGKTYEWDYNSKLVYELKEKLVKLGIPSSDLIVVDDYKTTSYNKAVSNVSQIIRDNKIDLGVEFHFNSSDNSSAGGFEYIYFIGSTKGRMYAKKFANAHKGTINSAKARGEDGIVARGSGRGAAMLEKTPCPFLITEPFFGSNKTEADFFRTDVGRLALIEIYAKALIDCYGRVTDAKSGIYVDMIQKLKGAQENLKANEDSESGLNKVLNDIKNMLNTEPFKGLVE